MAFDTILIPIVYVSDQNSNYLLVLQACQPSYSKNLETGLYGGCGSNRIARKPHPLQEDWHFWVRNQINTIACVACTTFVCTVLCHEHAAHFCGKQNSVTISNTKLHFSFAREIASFEIVRLTVKVWEGWQREIASFEKPFSCCV